MRQIKINFIRNILYAFSAQGISLLLSIFITLILPKILSVQWYSYWQLFIFYTSYVTILNMGLNEGIYLRYGGKQYSDINFPLLRKQMWLSVFGQSAIGILLSTYTIFFIDSVYRKHVILVVSVYMLSNNLALFFGYIFQAVNKTKIYSVSVIIDKLFFLAGMNILLVFDIQRFEPYIITYTLGKAVALLYCALKGKDIILASSYSFRLSIKEYIVNVSVGIKLLFASLANALIMGSSRIIIDRVWDISKFGMVSLAISLTSFFSVFINQVGMVLYPTLKRTAKLQQKQIYVILTYIMDIFLPIVYLLYIPVNFFLSKWLVNYEESFRYLSVLLPICIFDGRMLLLCNTYFKVLRKEKKLLAINFFSMGLSMCMSLIGAYVMKSVDAVVLSMVIAIGIRSIISELYLSRLVQVNIWMGIGGEVVLSSVFVICSFRFSYVVNFVVYTMFYLVYVLAGRSRIQYLIKYFRTNKN